MTIILNGTSGVTFPNGVTMASGTSAPVTVAQGGTGSATLTANNVLLGNGTSALQAVAPGTNGNVLTSNGTTWTSSALPAGGVTSLNGQTGAVDTTTLGNIGSVVFACKTQTTPMYAGQTIAGTSLYVPNTSAANNTNAFISQGTYNGLNATQWLPQYTDKRTPGNVGVTTPLGATALSGTWRCMGFASWTNTAYDPCSNFTQTLYGAGTFMRVS